MTTTANLKDVAKIAGVSVSTVSRALNGKSCVNEETKKRIMDAVEQTNYRPNIISKSLKMGKSNTICLLVSTIQNPIFAEITQGVEDTARKSGYIVVLCNTDEDEAIEREYIENMKTRWVDGFIICSAVNSSQYIKRLRGEGFPVVMVNRFDKEDEKNVDTVGVENYQAAYDATRYLIQTGHRRIALGCGSEELYLYRERYRGYREALEDAGISYDDGLVMRETYSQECFYQLTKKLMSAGDPPDAIFALSDPIAFRIMHALHDMNLNIPNDIAVIGFDNVELSSMVEPPLTTVSQPLYDLGCAAAKSLIRQIQHKDRCGELPTPVNSVLGTSLILRRSTR